MASALINGSGSSYFHFHVHTTDWHILFLGFYIVTFSLTLSDIESWLFWLWRVRFLYVWFCTLISRSIRQLRIFLSINDVIGFDCAHLYYFRGLRLFRYLLFFFVSSAFWRRSAGRCDRHFVIRPSTVHRFCCYYTPFCSCFPQDILVEFTVYEMDHSCLVWSDGKHRPRHVYRVLGLFFMCRIGEYNFYCQWFDFFL